MISSLIFTLLLTVSYGLRVAEGPAGEDHSVYIWDQVNPKPKP